MRFGAIEAGGTKMVIAIGTEEGKILEQIKVPTTTPQETMPQIIDYLRDKDIAAVGIACFGPIDLHRESETYGCITSTPKLAWKNFNIVKYVKDALGVPVGFDTDVNGSMLGEATWGCAKGLSDAIYLTVGTGIGGGVISGGKLLHGMLHPELGHMKVARNPEDTYEGKCPYHKDCFEGLAAGPAIEERWGKPARELADDMKVWELEGEYIAKALATYVCVLSPQKIILGGGVMHQEQLFPIVRRKLKEELGGYILTKELEDIDHYVVPASLHDDQGILGAVKLAMDELELEK